MADECTIKLTSDEALVLSHWLDQVIGTQAFDVVVNQDRAVWAPLHRIAGTLEKALPELIAPNYTTRLATAREHLLESLGDIGRPTTSP
jgi:hypothetical protein